MFKFSILPQILLDIRFQAMNWSWIDGFNVHTKVPFGVVADKSIGALPAVGSIPTMINFFLFFIFMAYI